MLSRACWPYSVTWPKYLPMCGSTSHFETDTEKAHPIPHIPSTALRFFLASQYNSGNTQDLLAAQEGVRSGVDLP